MMRIDDIPNKLPGETVQLFLRRHWIDLLRIIVFSGFMVFIPIAVLIVLASSGSGILTNAFWGPVISLSAAAYLLIIFVITITEFTDYWLDVWIVTSERIINSEQEGLFNRTVSELHLDQIQDITSETKGLAETFLTYGDVYVQTSAEKVWFHFKDIDNPEEVKQQIASLIKTCQSEHDHAYHHGGKHGTPGTVRPS